MWYNLCVDLDGAGPLPAATSRIRVFISEAEIVTPVVVDSRVVVVCEGPCASEAYLAAPGTDCVVNATQRTPLINVTDDPLAFPGVPYPYANIAFAHFAVTFTFTASTDNLTAGQAYPVCIAEGPIGDAVY